MGLRSKLSFEILTSAGADSGDSDSGAVINGLDPHPPPLNDNVKPSRRKRKQKKLKKKKSTLNSSSIDPMTENNHDHLFSENVFNGETELSSCSYVQSSVQEENVNTVCQVLHGELRKRSVTYSGLPSEEPSRPIENGNDEKEHPQTNVSLELSRKLETAESLDWKQLMAEDPSSYRCWVLRLFQFIFIFANNNPNESPHDALHVVH